MKYEGMIFHHAVVLRNVILVCMWLVVNCVTMQLNLVHIQTYHTCTSIFIDTVHPRTNTEENGSCKMREKH